MAAARRRATVTGGVTGTGPVTHGTTCGPQSVTSHVGGVTQAGSLSKPGPGAGAPSPESFSA